MSHANEVHFVNDQQRPAFHMMPPANWMNDPNGPIYYKGEYHLFYQYNPAGAFWANMHWGHAVSKDLVHWEHLPIALTPSESYDKDGVFSGCTVINESEPTIIYTGIPDLEKKIEVQCIATSKDMINWEKSNKNPIIDALPGELETTGFRDPFVWKEEDNWYMILGSGIKGVGGAILLYRSKDLREWEYINPIYIGEDEELEDMWECPNFFKLEDKYILVVSPYGKVVYWIGSYENYKFIPEKKGYIDLGDSYYAPNSFIDDKGRRIMWGWLKEQRSKEVQKAASWSGVMSVPREIFLHKDGSLGMKPIEELKVLRGEHKCLSDIPISADSTNLLDNVQGDRLEIIAEFEKGDASSIGLVVRKSPDNSEYTEIICNIAEQNLSINTKNSSLAKEVDKGVFGDCYNFNDDTDGLVKLHIFIDKSVIEVFVNERQCVTARVYPTCGDSLGLGLLAWGGKARLKDIDIWWMKKI